MNTGNEMRLSRFLPFAIALLFSVPALADPIPGDACPAVNHYQWSGGPENAGKYFNLFCDGTIWQPTIFFDTVNNVGMGVYDLSSLTTGTDNTVMGHAAGGGLTTGSGNVFVGAAAGYAGTAAGSQNTALGASALYNVTGGGNEAIGYNAGSTITAGGNNIIIGTVGNITTGSNNIQIGGSTGHTATASNQLDIADLIYGKSGNVGIGTSDPNIALDVNGSIEYTGTIADMSDRRLKSNIKLLSGQLDNIMRLRPVSFTMKDNPNTVELGLIAQDVESVFPELVGDSSGLKSMNYVGLIGPMIDAIQEQQAQIEQQNKQLERQQRQIDALLLNLDAPPAKDNRQRPVISYND